MPLLDHFHPPANQECPWEGVHSDWASSIARQLNRNFLPQFYRAFPRVYFGGRLEIDVATGVRGNPPEPKEGGGLRTPAWTPPRPTLEASVAFADVDAIEVQVFDQEAGRRLVAAVELVSPANKDRASHREAFCFKCAGYLEQGVSLAVVDVVTSRGGNLHRELLELLRVSPQGNGQTSADLYAVSYRTLSGPEKATLQVWEHAVTVGEPLPTVPLWISAEVALPLRLEDSYRETCEALLIQS